MTPGSARCLATINSSHDMNKYGVLVLHDQNITDAQQVAFSTVLGPLAVKTRPGTIRKASESGSTTW